MRAALSVSRRTLAKAWHDRILGMSAESAFWQLLSLPSLLIALLGTLGYAARWIGPDAVDQIRDWALDTAGKVLTPRVIDQVVAPVVSQILDQNRTDVIGIGTIIALWSGSSATATFVNTITIAYGQRDLRGAVRSRLVALRLYLFTVAAGVVVLPAVVFGPGALDRLFSGSWHRVISTIVHGLYWPVLGIVVFTGISTFYHLATPVRLRWRRAFPGAAVALILFLGLSYGLQVYFTAIATNLRVYSTLAAPILTLMYFYALAFAVLLGAEFNAALEERWPRGTRARAGEWLRETATRVRSRRTDEKTAELPEPAAANPGDADGATRHEDGAADAPGTRARPSSAAASSVEDGTMHAPDGTERRRNGASGTPDMTKRRRNDAADMPEEAGTDGSGPRRERAAEPDRDQAQADIDS
ncbi:YihY/virulence factor BrkB family protein [Actinocatenispora rupis]|uniref:YihY family inner membrane protein n=1 Tax=Actinocatenispora rupis TaxID=519421 RepID=A0A8J3NAY0_9ACTN|nr:YihY/virulence factor BrkB family protein [Actinocatenispora rupis]GID12814.1 hypothetical protein Aru02nite_37030 [Actinocatenispora rupis]